MFLFIIILQIIVLIALIISSHEIRKAIREIDKILDHAKLSLVEGVS